MGVDENASERDERPASSAASGRRIAVEAAVASLTVTALVTLASAVLPSKMVATAVGFVFLAATWVLVWRRDDAAVEHAGLALGGLVVPGPIDGRRVARDAFRAIAWALGFAAVAFVPFAFAWRAFWQVGPRVAAVPDVPTLASALFGQLVLIALPEEAFFRGYLQTRLDDLWPPTWRIGGAKVGAGLLVASLVFAVGHVATIHVAGRLAVFFPALLFGWLRARTGGIGASILFHALCNVFSEALGRIYGLY